MTSRRSGARRSLPGQHPLTLVTLLLLALQSTACLNIQPGTTGGGANPDPWEGMNRKIHAFNEAIDIRAIEPLAKGYDFIMPDWIQSRLTNAFDNLRMPITFANDLVTLRFQEAGEDYGRFLFNSTVGIAGLFDPATSLIELPRNDADFGLTLARYGVPSGPYLVLPIFGPSTVRGTIGTAGDAVVFIAVVLPWYVTVPLRLLETVNLRALFIQEIADNRSSSFDYYVFLRNAYLQNRASKVGGAPAGNEVKEEEEDIYFYDEEEEEEE